MVNDRQSLDLTTFARPSGGDAVEWRISNSPVPYPDSLAAMDARVAAIATGEAPELVWLLEHPPLYTSGTSGKADDLLDARFPTFQSGRGGQVTYHGPGQRVAYVMLDLKGRRPDVRAYVASLEEWIIRTLAAFNVRGERREDRVGVWVKRPDKGPGHEDKIAAIGVRLRPWVSLHRDQCRARPFALPGDRALRRGRSALRRDLAGRSRAAGHDGRRRHRAPAGLFRSVRRHRGAAAGNRDLTGLPARRDGVISNGSCRLAAARVTAGNAPIGHPCSKSSNAKQQADHRIPRAAGAHEKADADYADASANEAEEQDRADRKPLTKPDNQNGRNGRQRAYDDEVDQREDKKCKTALEKSHQIATGRDRQDHQP
jgi:lipoyl(octanoyl) transferase